MSPDKHKFQDTIEISHEKNVRNQFGQLIQIAKDFEQELGKEKTYEIIRKNFERRRIEMGKQGAESNPIDSLEDFIALEKRAFEHRYHIYTYTDNVTFTDYHQHVTECILAKVFRDLDAADLGQNISCELDFVQTKAHNPKLTLTRNKTLMQRDDCCDFCYTWEEE